MGTCAKFGHCDLQKRPLASETGQYPELDTLGKIAAALGVHPRELLDE
jgi:hypothetical protein